MFLQIRNEFDLFYRYVSGLKHYVLPPTLHFKRFATLQLGAVDHAIKTHRVYTLSGERTRIFWTYVEQQSPRLKHSEISRSEFGRMKRILRDSAAILCMFEIGVFSRWTEYIIICSIVYPVTGVSVSRNNIQ